MKKFISIFFITVLCLSACGLVTENTAPIPPPERATEAKLNKAEQQAEGSDETINKEDSEVSYIGNVKSKRFHRPSCHLLPAEKNRIHFKSREQAVKWGYIPCAKCKP